MDDGSADIGHLTLDDQFGLLLYKKLLYKPGSVQRRLRKYYKDKYKTTGIIPAPLKLAQKGIFEGRKCSGRPRSLTSKIEQRFVEMVKASCEHDNYDFMFISRKMRSISNYHNFLEEEFMTKISIGALRHFSKQQNLKQYLTKPDYDEPPRELYFFETRPVFDLIQMDGCIFRYFKIRNDKGNWQKPQVIEFFDTGSRYMFVLDLFFSESSLNSVDLFTQFLLSTPFPHLPICIRPDNAGGFLNLKRPIQEINLKYSQPNGFYMKPDFARSYAPKDKAHLESSHRSLHYFEARIIKAFEDKIVGTEPGKIYKKGKFETITVTLLDINLDELRTKGIIETYRKKHNNSKHKFSEKGLTSSWIPSDKFKSFISQHPTFSFSAGKVKDLMKYGFEKIKATVTTQRTIHVDKQTFYVTEGVEQFSRHKSREVKISRVNNKLLIFENKADGVFLGEAVGRKKYESPALPEKLAITKNEVEQITDFLEQKSMLIDHGLLVNARTKGLTLDMAKAIYHRHHERYERYAKTINHTGSVIGKALFNAFLVDYERHQQNIHVAPYATCKEE